MIEQEQLKIHIDRLAELQPEYQQLIAQLKEQEQHYQTSHAELVNQQQTIQQLHQQQEKQSQQKLEETRLKAQFEEVIEQKKSRLASVVEQLNTLACNNTSATIDDAELTLLNEQIEHLLVQQQNAKEKSQAHQKAIWQLNQQKSETLGTCTALEKQIAQLKEKLTQKADWQSTQLTWLEENNLNSLGELQQQLIIDDGWQLAIEMVLSHLLKAPFIEAFPLNERILENSPQSLLLLNSHVSTDSKVNTLAEKVNGCRAINSLLNSIHVAENYQAAIELLPQLNEYESVICPQGFWLSHHFIHRGLFNDKNDHFADANALEAAENRLSDLKVTNDDILQKIAALESEQQTLTTQHEEIGHQLTKRQSQVAEVKQSHALSQQKNEAEQQQRLLLQNERVQLEESIEQATRSLVELSLSAQNKNETQHHLPSTKSIETVQSLSESIQILQKQVQVHQTQQQYLTGEKHQLALSMEKTKNAESQCQQNIARFQENINQLTKQQSENAKLLDKGTTPLLNDEEQLQSWLAEMVTLDNALVKEQKSLSDAQEVIQSIEQKQRFTVEDINKLKESLNQLHLDGESYRLKAEAALEQLNELGQTVKSVQHAMPENARESQWQAQLSKLAKDLQMLGAINLAAIEEFETQLTRKNYLDQQDQDLNLAITTLESAIEKIDKESRHKFKITFDKVNQDLQDLFPKVFGGGQAYLTLTGDDLLDTGVTIMARPPGKKNSTIHLLSGGEKALTALSLVFAIFRLNPAPFCMLDEVDAPLDDANVSRFCNLVKEMSQTVQFIYISHNKIAMEMASHLTGVTMVEAGVSRMVAVDIDEAVAMAEVS